MNCAHVAWLAPCALLFGGCGERAGAASDLAPAIVFHSGTTDPHYGAVDLAPIPRRTLAAAAKHAWFMEDWQRVFPVRVGDSTARPMFGRYEIVGDTLRFTPSYPPLRGLTYRARFDSDSLHALSKMEVDRAHATGTWLVEHAVGLPTTVVFQVYPTVDTVPMNLLHMYIQFTAPMSVGGGPEHYVHLFDEENKQVENAFLLPANGAELWDHDHQRLTLFFDPGRIKRDLQPHDLLGLPLRTGHRYRLVVDAAWNDADGLPLAVPYEKKFYVGAIDRGLPHASAWRVHAPAAGARAPLTLEFPEPLDRAMLLRMLVIRNSAGAEVDGARRITNGERIWAFIPSAPWSAGTYYVEIDTELEDLAGNNLRRLFDVMPSDTASRGVSGASTRLAFTVR